MTKWLYGIATAAVLGLGSIACHIVTVWVENRNADHEILRQLVDKDKFLNGQIAEVPVAKLQK